MGATWCRQPGLVDPNCDRLCCVVGERTSRATGAYCGAVFLATIVTFALRQWATAYFQSSPGVAAGCECQTCYEEQIVLRSGFAMTACFLALAAVVWVAPHCVAFHAYYSWWLVKTGLAAALWFGALFMPNRMFRGLSYAFGGMAILFLLAQAVVMIDWAFSWNEAWRGTEPPQRLTGWRAGVVGAAGVLVAASGLLGGFGYGWFPCTLAHVALSVALGGGAVLGAVGLATDHASLLSGSVVLFQAVAMTIAGLRYAPGCGDGDDSLEIGLSLLLAGMTVTQAAWAVIRNADHAAGTRERGVVLEMRPQAAPGEELDPHEDVCGCWAFDQPLPERGAPAYLLILGASVAYMTMVLSGWAVGTTDRCTGDETGAHLAQWVHLGCAWVVLTLYAWALAAPAILPDRQF
jgi:hypothetical protein